MAVGHNIWSEGDSQSGAGLKSLFFSPDVRDF